MLADRSMSDRLLAALDGSPQPIFGPLDEVPMRPDIRDGLAANGLRQVLIVPLRTSGQVVGLLGLGWRGEPPAAAIEVVRPTRPPS